MSNETTGTTPYASGPVSRDPVAQVARPPLVERGAGTAGTGEDGAVDQARARVAEAGEQAQDKARDVTHEQVAQRSDQAGEALAGTAADVRAVGDSLRERGNDTGARIAEQAADYAQQAADYLKENGPDRILSDLEDLARRQPWVVAAGGLVVGFASARVLRASSRRREDADGRGDGYRQVAAEQHRVHG